MMKILFMGTPDFAVASLEALMQNGFDVCAVVSAPDQMRGRGMKLRKTEVKECAERYDLPVYQPERLKNGELLPVLKEYKPDVIVVVAYGKILPKEVLEFPKYGCINVHGSLLPKYRGAAPSPRAVLNGEKESGVCTMFMDEGLDTGDVILCEKTPIGEYETSADLFYALANMGGELLVKTLRMIEDGTAPRIPQKHDESTYAAMIRKEEAQIDWGKTADEIIDLVRGSNSWPIAFTYAGESVLKIYHAIKGGECKGTPGIVLDITKDGMLVACGDGKAVLVTELQMFGGKRMTPDAYNCGHPGLVGTTFLWR